MKTKLIELATKIGFISKNDPNKEEKEYKWLIELCNFIDKEYRIEVNVVKQDNDKYKCVVLDEDDSMLHDCIDIMAFNEIEDSLSYTLEKVLAFVNEEYVETDDDESEVQLDTLESSFDDAHLRELLSLYEANVSNLYERNMTFDSPASTANAISINRN